MEIDLDRLKQMSMAAQAEVFSGNLYGDARAAFLAQFTDDILHYLVHQAWITPQPSTKGEPR